MYEQIQKWTRSVKKVELTDSLKEKLGGDLIGTADELNKRVNVFTFTYDSNGTNIAGFLVAPKKCIQKLPVVIFNRGGTSDFGLVTNGLLFTRIAKLADQGYIVVGSQYPGNKLSKGHDERGGESDVESILKLHDLLTKLSMADLNNIGMYGESRGGMMTYICMTKVSWIKTVLTVGGQTDLDATAADRPEMNELYEKHFTNNQQNRDVRSVVKWVDKLNPSTPLCLLHGGLDKRVSVFESLELAEKLSNINHPYSLHIFNGGDHILHNVQKERDSITLQWFKKYLKNL